MSKEHVTGPSPTLNSVWDKTMFKFSCSIEWHLFISFKLNLTFLLLLYRLVSVMNIQEARCLSRKKGNNLLAQSVDMKLRRRRISACQVRLLRVPVEWLAFTLSLNLSLCMCVWCWLCVCRPKMNFRCHSSWRPLRQLLIWTHPAWQSLTAPRGWLAGIPWCLSPRC